MINGEHLQTDEELKTRHKSRYKFHFSLLFIVFLIYSLFSSIGFSANCPAPTDSCISNISNIILCEQGELIGLAFMIVIFLIGIAYIVGKFANNPRYLVWAKEEIYHVLFTAVLIIIFGAVLAFSCALFNGFFSMAANQLGASGCYSTGLPVSFISNCYLDSAISDTESLTNYYIQQYISNNMEAVFRIGVHLPLLTQYTLVPGAYKIIRAQQYNTIINTFLIPILVSFKIQKMILSIITENILQWLLPIAILLRIFSPTRSMADSLIALSIGIYLIVPFLYAFNLMIYDLSSGICIQDNIANYSPSIPQAMCDNVVDGGSCSSFPSTTCSNKYGFWAIARLLPQAYFMPNLVIAIVVTFISAFNKALKVVG